MRKLRGHCLGTQCPEASCASTEAAKQVKVQNFFFAQESILRNPRIAQSILLRNPRIVQNILLRNPGITQNTLLCNPRIVQKYFAVQS